MELKDKVAIVTGSSRGIGAETVKALAAHGAKVAVNYSQSRERGEQVLAEIRAKGGEGLLVRADVTERDQVEAMVREVQEQLGPVDILVNNAAISFPMVPFTEFRWEDFERKLVSELKACFFPCQAVVPGMVRRGRGSIVNISSGLSRHPGLGFSAHSTAKSALDAFSKSLALELGPAGIRVNVVAPGLTETEATAFLPAPAKEASAQHTPLRRIGQPEDLAGAVLFFCSEASRFVTGTYLPVCGGSQML
jgi:3-oxoacyl-[acyl-carrier protein] reductase